MEEPKPTPISEVIAKLRESFTPLIEQLTPDVEPATVYSLEPEQE